MPLVLLHHASSSLRRQPDMLIQLQRLLKNESGAAEQRLLRPVFYFGGE
jgi:hypothetical protein